MVRLIKLPHVGEHLDAVFGVFGDEKDSWLVLTHIYLLGGCSAPLWLHPVPSEAPAVLLPLAAGMLSVGVGDAAASVCGSLFGHHHWPGNKAANFTATPGKYKFILRLFHALFRADDWTMW